MSIGHTEKAFENAIEDSLLNQGGYNKADPENFDRARCLDPSGCLQNPGNDLIAMQECL